MKKVFAVVAVLLVMASGFASACAAPEGGGTTHGTTRDVWAG